MLQFIYKYGKLCKPFFIILLIVNCSKKEDAISNINNDIVNSIYTDFTKTFGGTKNESAQSVVPTKDGGYAILGYTQSMDGDITTKANESFDYWVMKLDSSNTMEWQKTYGGTDSESGQQIINTRDDGFVLIGSSKSNDGDISANSGSNDFWVIKTNANGVISWEKSFGFSGSDSGFSVIQTHDDGFLLTGVLDVSASLGQGNSKENISKKHAGGDYWVIKINSSGEKAWSKFYGGSLTDTPHGIVQTKDNGFILIGTSDSNDVDISSNINSYDFWVIKISETGTLEWEKSFGGSEIDEAFAIEKSNDGNYLIVGNTRSSNFNVSKNRGSSDLWVIKISQEGELLWEKTFGGSDFDSGNSIFKTQDNNFIISGSSRSLDGDLTENKGENDAWVLKIDNKGNLLWQKTLGGFNFDLANDAIELNDKSVIVVGNTESSDQDIEINKGSEDLLLIKIQQNN